MFTLAALLASDGPLPRMPSPPYISLPRASVKSKYCLIFGYEKIE